MNKKRIISLVLALMMIVTIMPANIAWAEDVSDVIYSENGKRGAGIPSDYVKVQVNFNEPVGEKTSKVYYVNPNKEVYIPAVYSGDKTSWLPIGQAELNGGGLYKDQQEKFPSYFDKSLAGTFDEDTEINMLYGQIKPVILKVGDIFNYQDIFNHIKFPGKTLLDTNYIFQKPEKNQILKQFAMDAFSENKAFLSDGRALTSSAETNMFGTSDAIIDTIPENADNDDFHVKFRVQGKPFIKDDIETPYSGQMFWYPLIAEQILEPGTNDKHINLVIPATFCIVDDIIPQIGDKEPIKPDYYVPVEFRVPNGGNIKDGQVTKYWVTNDKEIEILVPEVEVDNTHTFTGWDKPLKATFKEATIINANINDIIFNDNNIIKIEVVREPNKMVYNDGENFDATGLTVKLTDNRGLEKTVSYNELSDYNITVEPANMTKLSISDNGQTIKLRKDGLNTVESYGKLTVIGSTRDNERYPLVKPAKTEVMNKEKLTSYERDKVEKEVKKVNPNAKIIEVMRDGSVTLTYADGSINKLKQEDTVIQKGIFEGKKDNEKYPVSKPAKTGVKDRNRLTETEKDRVKEAVQRANRNAKSIYVRNNGDTILTYKDGSENRLYQRDTVYEVNTSREPDVDKIKAGDKYIAGKGVPYSKIAVTLPGGKVITGKVNKNGQFKIAISAKLVRNDIVYVAQAEPGMSSSDKVKMVVYGDSELKSKVKNKLNTEQHSAYIVGYPDGTFKPNNTITRAEVAAIFARLSRNQNASKDIDFYDVNYNDWFYKSVRIGVSEGFINGYGDGSFRPDKQMTRAEFAAVISNYAHKEASRSNFNDVNGWSVGVIDMAYANGWMTGYGNSMFKPEESITRAEAVSVINRMLNRNPDAKFIDNVLLYGKKDAKAFKDVKNNDWFFYDVYASAWGHDYKIEDGMEKWTKLNGKVFEIK